MSSQRGEPANDGGRATHSLRSFRSAIDGWMVALFVIPTGFALLMVILKAGLTTRPGLIAAAVVLGGGVLLPAVLYAITGYQLTDTELVVRVGPFTTRIPYSQIQSIEPSRDVESAPAWSLHRLRVAYGTGQYVLISPHMRGVPRVDRDASPFGRVGSPILTAGALNVSRVFLRWLIARNGTCISEFSRR